MIAFELKMIYSQFRSLSLLMFFFLSSGILMSQNDRSFALPSGISKEDFSQDFIIVKFTTAGNTPKITKEISSSIKVKKISKAIKLAKSNQSDRIAHRTKSSSQLDNIVKIELAPGEDVIEAVNRVLNISGVEYAEPYYFVKTLKAPNDPAADPVNGSQDYLKQINAYEAWEIEKGSSSVIIGILDTGVDYDHEDLKGNHSKNLQDPVDKFDNDNDNYIDNHLGWDFANYDNDPMADKSSHGTMVAGIAASTPDNSIGTAGIGYHSGYMPIKIFRSQDNMFNGGYEAIVYAAEKGCKVINLSWGSANAYSNYAQDLINYTVLDLDAVVVAAAGNTDQELNFYPASYENVLSVGALDDNDLKASWATYSRYIDIMAPGTGIYTTNNGNQYNADNGSSFAAPMVAGAAALVRARFPQLNALQVMERLRMSCDDIYQVPGNEKYKGLLGRGKLNVANALLKTDLVSVRMESFNFYNKSGAYAFFDDTVSITGNFKSYLADSKSIKISLTAESPYVTLVNSEFQIHAIFSGEVKNNTASPFQIYLDKALPPNHKLVFRLDIVGETFTDVQYFHFNSTPSFLTLGNSNLSFTVASDGNLGINDDFSYLGTGLTYDNQRILEQIGFMVATSPDKVMNNVITDFKFGSRNKDFVSTENIKLYTDSEADMDARSNFQPLSSSYSQALNIEQKVLKWEGSEQNDYFIIEYRVSNISGADLPEVRTGIFANWNLNDFRNNRADWDNENKLGFVYDGVNENLFSGIALLSDLEASYFAIDQKDFNGNTPTFGDYFTRENKFKTLSTGIEFSKAGMTGTGNDVSQNVGANLGQLKNGESIKLAFVLVAGSSLADLQESIHKAKSHYNQYLDNPPVLSTLRVCPGNSINIDPEGTSYHFYKDPKLQDLLYSGTSYTFENLTEPKSLYVVNLDKKFTSDVRQIKVQVDPAVADFSMSTDTLYIQEGFSNSIYFKDLSRAAKVWKWTFNNGYESTVKDPKIIFNEPGEYIVNLLIENQTGCSGSLSKKLVVIKNPALPGILNQMICKNESAILQASNTNFIKVYKDHDLTDLVFEGSMFITAPLISDEVYFVTNIEDNKESLPLRVTIDVSDFNPDYTYSLTESQQDVDAILFENSTLGAVSQSWYVNGTFYSSEKYFQFPIDGQNEIEVKLESSNETNCFNSISKIISIKQSTKPEEYVNTVCQGELLVLTPGTGFRYKFYEDSALTKLIHTGSSFEMQCASNRLFYITNHDDLIESNAAKAEIFVTSVNPEFVLDKDTIYLNEESILNIKNNTVNGIHFRWELNSDFISEEVDFSYDFKTSGIYTVKLTAINGSGCSEMLKKDVVVLDYRSETPDLLFSHLNLYPNPTSGKFQVNFNQLHKEDNLEKIVIFNSSGVVLISKAANTFSPTVDLDLTGYNSGVYTIQLHFRDGITNRKVILSN